MRLLRLFFLTLQHGAKYFVANPESAILKDDNSRCGWRRVGWFQEAGAENVEGGRKIKGIWGVAQDSFLITTSDFSRDGCAL